MVNETEELDRWSPQSHRPSLADQNLSYNSQPSGLGLLTKASMFQPYFLSIVGPQYCRVVLGIAWLADCHQHVPSHRTLMRAVHECLFEKISRHGLLLRIGELIFTIMRHEAPPDHGALFIPVDQLEGVNAVK